MINEDLEERFDAATALLDEVFSGLQRETGLAFKELLGIPYVEFMIWVQPGIETNLDNGRVFHTVDEGVAALLAGAAQRVPEAYELVREIIARNVFEGQPVPKAWRGIARQIVTETFDRPKRRGAPHRPDFMRPFVLREAALLARDAFHLDLHRNEETKSQTTCSACDAASFVARVHGEDIPYQRISEWCYHKKHADFRLRADAVSNLIKDLQLEEWGVLRHARPFGPFLELGRMRRRG